MKTWKELEAEGVKRCCAMFKSGKRCARRAVGEHDFSWCAKHGPMIERAIAFHNVCSACGKRFPVGGKCNCRRSQ